MSKLLIVTCTKAKNEEEFQQRPIFHSLRKQCELNSNTNFYIFKENQRGLSDCYNDALTDPSNLDKTVLFVHDDVVLEDLFLYEKLMQSPYSITGLAGAKTFNKQADKLAWHLCADRKDFVGKSLIFKTKRFGPLFLVQQRVELLSLMVFLFLAK